MIRRRLVRRRKLSESLQRIFGILVGAQLKRIDAAAVHEKELIAQHVADCTQLAAITVALAQQARDRVAAAIGELRKLEGHELEVV